MEDFVDARVDELRSLAEFLAKVQDGPVGVVIEGEAGIGKTTLWLEAIERARAAGFQVLSAQGSPAEARSTFTAAADLLGDVDTGARTTLPPIQQAALDRMLLLGDAGPATDARVVSTAFLSVIERLAITSPVLLAIDDAQWLDVASRAVVGFAARRFSGRVGVIVTARTGEHDGPDVESWLRLARPDAMHRLSLRPMSLGALHGLIAARIGHTVPRTTIVRIHQISAGNPFYGLELARALDEEPDAKLELTDSLAGLVRRRVGHLDAGVADLLLAIACLTAPTTSLLSRALGGTTEDVLSQLDAVETQGIVEYTRDRVRFTHPLLAHGVYQQASGPRRRAMHRRVAAVVDEPELRARHLALAATTAEPDTMQALDRAAEIAANRGAPGSAAELVELAIGLGGDDPSRWVRAAELHFRAGSLAPARGHLVKAVGELPRGTLRCLALMLLGAVRGYDDDAAAAVEAMRQAVDEADDESALRLLCLLRLALGMVSIGRVGEAVEHAATAVALADRLGVAELRSQALSIWVAGSFVYGLGVDQQALDTALELEDPRGDATTWYRASAVEAVISAWSGDLGRARVKMQAVRDRTVEAGTEIDIIWAANRMTVIDLWLGRYADAAHAAQDAVLRAEQMAGRNLLITAWSLQASVAAHMGLSDLARSSALDAISAARQIGGDYMIASPTATLAFLEVAQGNHAAAVAILEPLLATFDAEHDTEIVAGGYLPDAIEALVAVGRLDDAAELVRALESAGARTDRAWMCAVGARGRAHLCAAVADLVGADEALATALTHHERLEMPFERGRTLLLLGQIQRRRRHRTTASATLTEALATFDDLGSPVWAQRARAELERLQTGTPAGHVRLTPAEYRIAARAASGMPNRQIGAELFVSVKTVEATLTAIYRKLDIRSRAQLFAKLAALDTRENLDAED